MIKIIVYFFLIFGIADFILMIWQFVSCGTNKERKIFLILPAEEAKKSTYETISILKRFPYRIYFLSENKTEIEIKYKKHFEDLQTVTTEQLTEEINKNYGNYNRQC